MNYIIEILYHILKSLYQFTGASIVFAFLSMFFLFTIEKLGIKKSVAFLWDKIRNDEIYRRYFVFFFYLSMILLRTVFCRNIWSNPLSNICGEWGLYDANGRLYTENIENVLLFIPFTYLLTSIEYRKGRCYTHFLPHLLVVSSCPSLVIETLQLFFKVGTFQLSDLFYNSIGGLLGGLIFQLTLKAKRKEP